MTTTSCTEKTPRPVLLITILFEVLSIWTIACNLNFTFKSNGQRMCNEDVVKSNLKFIQIKYLDKCMRKLPINQNMK